MLSAADPLVGTVISGRFRVDDLIGQGGMGKVYRARHLALDRTIVLKMLKPQLLEDPTLVGRFEREAKAASRLNHPNVIQVLDFGRLENDGTLYIVMEHVQGKDLRLVLRDDWPLAEERLCNIMAQVCSALGEAHVNDVIHRDLKPENVMVEARRDQPDHVKVLDFGIAKILGPDVPALPRQGAVRVAEGDQPGLTRHDVVCGTPQYMAPEQATGSALDERCDLYAVGVILYQMTTGHLPFDGASAMEVLTRHVNEAPVPPRQRQPDAPISEAMERLILRSLEKDPAKRPQTAEQFRDELLAVPDQARSAARATTPSRSTTPVPGGGGPLQAPRRTWRGLWIAGIATVVLAVLAVTAAIRRQPPRGPVAPGGPTASRDAALARPPPQRLGLAAILEQTPDGLGERGDVAGGDDGAGALEDLRNHRHGRGHDGTAEGHRVEDLRRHLAHGIAGCALGHGHDVGGDEIARHVVERDLAHHLHVRHRRPASR